MHAMCSTRSHSRCPIKQRLLGAKPSSSTQHQQSAALPPPHSPPHLLNPVLLKAHLAQLQPPVQAALPPLHLPAAMRMAGSLRSAGNAKRMSAGGRALAIVPAACFEQRCSRRQQQQQQARKRTWCPRRWAPADIPPPAARGAAAGCSTWQGEGWHCGSWSGKEGAAHATAPQTPRQAVKPSSQPQPAHK